MLLAPAGMFPSRHARPSGGHGAPRTRGDVPAAAACRCSARPCSSHPRGCSQVRSTYTYVEGVLPAPAGMFPAVAIALAESSGAHRTREDVPNPVCRCPPPRPVDHRRTGSNPPHCRRKRAPHQTEQALSATAPLPQDSTRTQRIHRGSKHRPEPHEHGPLTGHVSTTLLTRQHEKSTQKHPPDRVSAGQMGTDVWSLGESNPCHLPCKGKAPLLEHAENGRSRPRAHAPQQPIGLHPHGRTRRDNLPWRKGNWKTSLSSTGGRWTARGTTPRHSHSAPRENPQVTAVQVSSRPHTKQDSLRAAHSRKTEFSQVRRFLPAP